MGDRHRDRHLLALLKSSLLLVSSLAACRASEVSTPKPQVQIAPLWIALQPGDSTRFTATVLGPAGDTVAAPAVTWSSSAPGVAEVDASGTVRARAVGVATVTVSFQGGFAGAAIAVTPAVLVGAGDIASCSYADDEATGRLLDSIRGVVFTAGDDAYPNGTVDDFAHCYDPTWGRHKSRTRPAIGNHDFRTDAGAPYYAYFGAAAGDSGLGYYSYDLAGWHVIVLNSNLSVSAGSPQNVWLHADLSAHSATCTVAYWHHPRFSSGEHGNSSDMEAAWQALYDANGDVVISAHDHTYERFAPQTPTGALDTTRGIREFVAGTGGSDFYAFTSIRANSQVRINTVHGVLKLTLYPSSYEWAFIGTDRVVYDSGTGSCH